MLLLVLAFVIGFAGYFIAWPHGREIGILGVPFGLTIWAGRSGPMRILTQVWNEAAERTALVHSLRVGAALLAADRGGRFRGVLLAQRLRPAPKTPADDGFPEESRRQGTNVSPQRPARRSWWRL